MLLLYLGVPNDIYAATDFGRWHQECAAGIIAVELLWGSSF